MPKLVAEVEAFFSSEATVIETELEADWAELKPAAIAWARASEGMVLTAAQTFITSGGDFGRLWHR